MTTHITPNPDGTCPERGCKCGCPQWSDHCDAPDNHTMKGCTIVGRIMGGEICPILHRAMAQVVESVDDWVHDRVTLAEIIEAWDDLRALIGEDDG